MSTQDAGGESNGSRRQAAYVITATTLVPIGLAVVVIVTAITLKTWIDTKFEGMSTQIAELRLQMKLYEQQQSRHGQDQWRGVHMRLFASELARLNPTVQVPNVSTILQSSPDNR